MRKDRFGFGDSLIATIVTPDEEPETVDGIQEEQMVEKNVKGLQVEESEQGYGVFQDNSEAPVTIGNKSWFDTEEEAQAALLVYAEAR